MALDEPLDALRARVAKKLRVTPATFTEFRIYKESIDARKPHEIWFSYTIDVTLEAAIEQKILSKKPKNVAVTPDLSYHFPTAGKKPLTKRPVVIGFGPAGMFAALLLAQMGYKPLVLERGEAVDARVASIERFWADGKLNPASNVQFGEGGAGTFSDGKLTTRVRDLRSRKVIEEFVAAGAPEDILYKAHPHVGTDLLRGIVKNIRQKIIQLGGSVSFEHQVTDFETTNGKLSALTMADGTRLLTDAAILAIGHSARDTFEALYKRKIAMQAKPFAVGVRIEHPQTVIDRAQYKEFAGHARLGAAEYRLTYKAKNGRGVYTFCMCPGGLVVPSSSEPNRLVTNGMSEHARDAQNANSGLLVQIFPEDFPDNSPLAGVAFQRELEEKAFKMGGGGYKAPAQLVGDFLANRASTEIRTVTPSYALGVTPTNLAELFPDWATEDLRAAIRDFDNKLHGFAMPDAVMTGVESRSSSPIRINRDDETLESLSTAGLYPAGEGAGFAGGIVSAAIDGLKVAEKLIETYASLSEY